MMKQGFTLTPHNRFLITVAMLCAFMAFALDAIPESPDRPMKAIVRITNPHLKADMLRILDSFAGTSNEWTKVAAGLKPRFIPKEASLQPTEIVQAVKIFEYYRNTCEKKFPNAARVECLLIALGDSAAITNAVKNIAEGGVTFLNKVRSDLVRSEQPKVIIALGELLFRDEGVTPKVMGEEFLVYPLSVETTQIIIEVLSTCEQFPPSVRTWALKETVGVDPKKRRELVRQWWEKNEEALKEERFSETVPLETGK